MRYNNLKELIYSSRSSREYFFALPVSVQLELSLRGEYIGSAEELHRFARAAESDCRRELLRSRGHIGV